MATTQLHAAPSNINSIWDIFVYAQTLAPIGEVIIIVIWIIAFVTTTSRWDYPESFLVSNLVGFFLAMLFVTGGVLDILWLHGSIIMTGLAGLYLYYNRNRSVDG